MFVCICNAVTDRHIRQAVAEGVASVEELRLRTGCGDCCGQCMDEVECLLRTTSRPVLPLSQGLPFPG